jgi:AcrR family transcriptional regulator
VAKAKRSGRRSGNPDTKTEILTAARELFAAEGFESVSVRRIAAAADVDPALVHHYFGSKDDLFLSAIELPVDPSERVKEVISSGGIEGLGGRLMHALVDIWEGPHGDKFVAVIRTGISRPSASFLLRQLFEHRILKALMESFGEDLDHPKLRANLVASQIFGLVVTRYILKLKPLAALDAEALAETVGPNIDRYLTMPVEHLDPDA